MDKLDGFLSRKAQFTWPRALVFRLASDELVIRRPGVEDLGIGDNFSAAHHALIALIRAEKNC